MAKPELGTKRLCGNCGAKFYDLSKDPIVCPKCHTVWSFRRSTRGRDRSRWPPARRRPRLKRRSRRPRRPRPSSFRSRKPTRRPRARRLAEGDVVEGAEDDVELEDEGMDDATFIEEQEEGDEDVTDIIGDVEDEEET